MLVDGKLRHPFRVNTYVESDIGFTFCEAQIMLNRIYFLIDDSMN